MTAQLAVKIAIYLVMAAICIFTFLLIMRISYRVGNLGEKITNKVDDTFTKNGTINRYKRKMSRLGIMYRAGNYSLNPSWYITIKATSGIILGLLLYGLLDRLILIPIGIVVGYFATELYFKHENKVDNKEIMIDIYNTYTNLKIQLKSGLYIGDSLEYSHSVAQNERYKEALGELVLNFSDRTIPMEDAIETFKNRFDSKEIDKLSALLQTFVQYGQNEEYTKDIMTEIQSIILSETMETEHDIETKANTINFAFFTIILAIVGYALIRNFAGLDLFA